MTGGAPYGRGCAPYGRGARTMTGVCAFADAVDLLDTMLSPWPGQLT